MSSESQNPRNVYHIGGVPVEFPYQPYGSQLAFMGRLIATLDRAQREGHGHALLESPTGTGKSLSLLCSALAWQRHHGSRGINPNPIPSTPDPRASNDPLNYGGGFLPESQQTRNTAPEPIHSTTNGNNQKKKPVPTIYYASRTHSQISQVVREYRKTAYRVPMAVLASRKHYCTNKAVRGRENLDEECKLLLDNPETGCSEFKNAHRVKCHPSIQKGGCHEAHDIEDLVKVGQLVKGCSYFAARSMAEDALLVFCPYSYIINPVIRRAMDVDIRGSVIILDEAHNIEDIAREAGSVEVNEEALIKLQRELNELSYTDAMIYQPLHEMIQDFISWIERRKSTLEKRDFQHYFSSWTGEKALKELQEANLTHQCFPILHECAVKAIKAASDTELGSAHLSGLSSMTLEGLYSSLGYFFKSSGIHINDYQLTLQRLVKRDAGNRSGHLEYVFSLSCLHPAVVFKDIADASLSVILTSGTLSPMNSLSSELGVQFGTCLEAPHIINVESQVWTAAISTGPGNYPLNASYKTASVYAFQDALGKALEEIFDIVPGGSLVFFPSYKLMDKLCSRWQETGQWLRLNAKKPLFVEPRGSQDELENVLKGYYTAVSRGSKQSLGMRQKGKKMNLQCSNSEPLGASKKKGAGFLAVCRGKVSEGIDFSDDYARAILVGIPFPNINDVQVVEKKRYNDMYKQSKCLESGSVWYCHQAFRALNQAAGRCIRHKLDHGAIIFLDERFRESRNTMYISKWLRNSVRQYDNFETSIEELRSFFSDVKMKVAALHPQPISAMTQEKNGCDMETVKKKIPKLSKSEIAGQRLLPETVMLNRGPFQGLKSNSHQTANPLSNSRVCQDVETSLEDCSCTISSPVVSPSKDEYSNSTVTQSPISMEAWTQTPTKVACSLLNTPKSTATKTMISDVESSFYLSVDSLATKRRRPLSSPLTNFCLEEKPILTSSNSTHENGVTGISPQGKLKGDSSQHAEAIDITSIEKFAFTQRQSSGGWRTTRSKLRLPRKAILHDVED
ncbi:hypothetical protein V2J09_007027 [Rumex salicifolius]